MAKDSPRRKTKGAPTAETDVKIEIDVEKANDSKKSKLTDSRNSVHHNARKTDSRKSVKDSRKSVKDGRKSVKSPKKSTKEESKKPEKGEKSKGNEHLEKENKSRRETLKTVDLESREFTYEKEDFISEAAQQLLAERDKVNLIVENFLTLFNLGKRTT